MSQMRTQIQLLEEAQDMSAILNLAMDEIEFHFRKVSEKERFAV